MRKSIVSDQKCIHTYTIVGSPGHKWKGKWKIQKWLNVFERWRKNDNKIYFFSNTHERLPMRLRMPVHVGFLGKRSWKVKKD